MDVLMLSRLQFAATTFFHFLFVPLTLGLGILMAVMETQYVRTGQAIYKRMVKFWGKIFLLNFALGVVTGIPLEFQFGTNWSKYSEFVGDVFGSILAIEASVAFFLESTFIGIWIFAWDRISPRFHAACMWFIAIGTNISAFWILVANAWMQNPVGYTVRNGRAELVDFGAVVTSQSAILEFMHTVLGSYILAAFLVMGISAWHLLRKNEVEFFTKSFQYALIFGLFASVLTAGTGHLSGIKVHETQPAKLAAMEALWETTDYAPMTLIMWPDPENETNHWEFLEIPGLLSILASEGDPSTVVRGLKDFPPEDRPPVTLTWLSFRIMVGLGTLFLIVSVIGWIWRRNLRNHPRFLKLMIWMIPLPYLALELGWIVTEVGRQPWIVYGLMRTRDAVSTVPLPDVWVSFVGFILVYGLLGILDFALIYRIAKRGPEPAQELESAAVEK